MLDAEALKLELWAQDGDRTDPADATPAITPSVGFPSSFSMASGDTPSREVMNQILRILSGAGLDVLRFGIPPWDARQNYKAGAIVPNGDMLVQCNVATGPATSNATNPTTANQAVWFPLEGFGTGSSSVAEESPKLTNRLFTTGGQYKWPWADRRALVRLENAVVEVKGRRHRSGKGARHYVVEDLELGDPFEMAIGPGGRVEIYPRAAS